MAWSLALGMVIGINPSVGVTTGVVLLLAWCFRLSKMASLVGSHIVAPLHFLLFIPFIQLGVHIFRTRKLPVTRQQLAHMSHHPMLMMRELWQWQWHALVVWALAAAVLMPLLAMVLRRWLVVLLRKHGTLLRSRNAVN